MQLKLEEVFKIGGTPSHTFVHPIEYPALLVALRTPGRGVVVEGPSGIGKTTAVNQALQELGFATSAITLSARKPVDVELIKELPQMNAIGIVLIEDFHSLEDEVKQSIANFMKVLADEERTDSKIVVLGINKAGAALIQFAHDLNNRLEIIPFEANPIEKVEELIALGERALNIKLNVGQEICQASNGSFYIAQMLAHQTCLDSGILQEQAIPCTTTVSFELTKGKVFERLARNFQDRTEKFCRGTRFRKEGRAPYLHLLHWLAVSDQWSLSIDQAVRSAPELRGSITQIVEKGYLAELIQGDSKIQEVLHYDPHSRQLTVEDPQFIYFIRNISWSQFVKSTGFLGMEFASRYDFALSFAGADREIAEMIYQALVESELEVFYDRNEQHRILAEDIEDYLRPIYQSDAEFVLVLLGAEYPKRIWTRFESEQFKNRFKDGAVVPIWLSTSTPGAFDETSKVGGINLDVDGNLTLQVSELVELLRRKLAEKRGFLL